MKAIVYHTYGSPEVLKLKEIPKPIPKDKEVLVKVVAVSVNSWDWDLLKGEPILIRMWGLFRPGYNILGSDIAGVVENVGSEVKNLNPGDEVFGDLSASGWGGFAEYVCAPENALALKPANMTFEQAASLPQAGVLAYQGLFDYGKIESGKKVLINGAGGGVGTFAIQIAKSIGAQITGVDSHDKLEKLKELGADHVIDYEKEDFTKMGKHYDLIIDNVAIRSLSDYKRTLNPGGIFVMVGGSMSTILQAMLFSKLLSTFGTKKLEILAHKPNKDLDALIELYDSGAYQPILEKTYSLSETPEALRLLGEGKAFGKIVISTGL
jgi:NADPH:quinone reductase-like Zn-dependent oxidoreductase